MNKLSKDLLAAISAFGLAIFPHTAMTQEDSASAEGSSSGSSSGSGTATGAGGTAA